MNRLAAVLAAVSFAACGLRGPEGPTGPEGPQGPAGAVDLLQLPGASYYPESLTAAADGTLYVGSLPTGEVVRFRSGQFLPETFLEPGTVKGVAGVLADDASGQLWLCAVDVSFATPTEVRSFDLATGAPRVRAALPANAFCNDLALDAKRNLYATDSFGNVYRLPAGGSALEAWASDPRLAPSTQGGFGADGIAFDGSSALYVNTFSDGRLLRIPIGAGGAAGAVEEIAVSPALQFPDGMRLAADGSLLVAEGAGRLTRVTVSGSAATAVTVANRLDAPTSVVRVGGSYWVTEGQLPHLFGQASGGPLVPFLLRRVTAP
ncbi:MAG TPA: hypothetical protein VFA20_25070 [Myxococcaceae bacterium]|nr:hypothetical protein [Myxococcaceae bacterium]